MPYFDVLCPTHGKQEVFGSVGCPLCSDPVKRLWSNPPKIVVDFTAGWDPGAGRVFSTKRERDNWVSSKGIRRLNKS
jgi:hypothetical protein